MEALTLANRGWRIGAALLIALAVGTGSAFAQVPPAPSDSSQAPPPDDAARAHLEAGLRHYNLAEYDKAIEEFKAAYTLSPAPGLLFNIAQAYRLKGRDGCAESARFYKNYLRVAPNEPNRALVESRIEEMDRCVAEQSAPPPAAPSATAAPRPASATRRDESVASAPRWPPIALAAVGVALGAVGAVLLVSAASEYGELHDSCGVAKICNPADWRPYRTREQVGVTLAAVGGAALVGGGIWWLALPSSHGAGHAGGVGWRGRF